VKILVIVNASPWGGTLAVTALRLVRCMVAEGHDVAAIYFREEGVYQTLVSRAADSGTPVLREAWLGLHHEHGVPLLVCSSASQRRLEQPPGDGFREAGLAEVLEKMQSCDHLVTF